MKIKNVNKTEANIHKEIKEEKFSKLVSIQEDFIKEAMKEGRKSVVWIFNNAEYYHNALERSWFEEFKNEAKRIFEKAEYRVNGVLICW